MIVDFRASGALDLPRDAVVVVGSGAAGLPLALRLADRGHPVVLLESGGDVHDPAAIEESAHLSEGVSHGPFRGLANGRARVFGGTTQLWAGQCMRLLDIDLRRRPWVPDSGWPIPAADLDDAYVEAERWLGVSGRGYEEHRWAEFPQLPPLAWNPDRLRNAFTEIPARPYLGTTHRDRVARHPHLTVVLHATVGRVRVEDGHVRGVEVLSPSGRRQSVAAGRVVLAAGTIENTRLLQLSDPAGIGLGAGREHTGRYLQDHPRLRTAEIVASDHRLLQDRYVALHRSGQRLWPRVRLATAAQEQYGLLDAVAVFDHEHDDAGLLALRRIAEEVQRRRLSGQSLRDLPRATAAVPLLLRGLYRRRVRGLGTVGTRPEHVWLQVWVEQAPKPDRRITLADTRDALGLRQAAVTWRCDAEELETSRRLTRWIAEDLDRLGVAQVRELPAMTDDDAWHATVQDTFHPAGTTRMSDGPRHGVVDRDLQVHGVRGLHVVGGSVFPTSGYANPTLTIVALSLRLAAHLHRDLRGPTSTVDPGTAGPTASLGVAGDG